MQNLRFLVLLGLMSLFTLAGRAQQPPPHIAGVPNITWGMTPGQVQQLAPGQMAGQILVYQTDYFGYPVVGQYYFTQEQLRYATFAPRYAYENPATWQPEYQRLNQELTNVYGNPTMIQENQAMWKTPDTQTILLLQPNGWMTRYDRIPPQGTQGGR